MDIARKRELLRHLVSVLVDERARMVGQPMELAVPEPGSSVFSVQLRIQLELWVNIFKRRR